MITVSRMPDFYRPPLGLPLYWQDDRSGRLPAAVMAYYHHAETPMTQEQAALVIEFLAYFIGAPCWLDVTPPAGGRSLEGLRRDAPEMKTADDITRSIAGCLQIGLDPL